MRFLARILTSALGLYVADRLLEGTVITGGWVSYLVGGVVLGVLTAILRPILKFISFPINFLTFGLFNLVIVLGLLWLADQVLTNVAIQNLRSLILTAVIIELINGILVFL